MLPNEAIVALAEKLAQIAPGEISKTYFTNSGTEANETAVQFARTHTGHFEIVALRHGYSGRSQTGAVADRPCTPGAPRCRPPSAWCTP